MNINIKTGTVELTPAISNYVDKRMEKVVQLLSNDAAAKFDLELARTTGHHQKGNIFRAEIHITGAHKNYYAASEEPDLFAAIDLVRDSILRDITAGKAKKMSLMRRGGARIKEMVKGLWGRG